MPIRYKAEHFEYPKRLELPVVKELTDNFEVVSIFGSFEARTKLDLTKRGGGPMEFMTKCHHCGGWVPGRAHEHHVNNLDGQRLCGRKGTEFYCPRCGQEVHFSGMMS